MGKKDKEDKKDKKDKKKDKDEKDDTEAKDDTKKKDKKDKKKDKKDKKDKTKDKKDKTKDKKKDKDDPEDEIDSEEDDDDDDDDDTSSSNQQTRDANDDDDQPRPLNTYDDATKRSYMAILAAVSTVDSNVSEAEVNFLRAMIEAAGLSPESQTSVCGIIDGSAPPEIVNDSLSKLAASGSLRFSLIADVMAIAAADGVTSVQEKQFIDALADRLNVSAHELAEITQYVQQNVPAAAQAGAGQQQQQQQQQAAAGMIPAAGTPAAALAQVAAAALGPQAGSVVQGLLATPTANKALGALSAILGSSGLANKLGPLLQ
jgi:uncharacterized tellurite resistance protein B-like protein